MFSRLKVLWFATRDSLWFLPTIFTIASILLAVVLVQLEKRYQWELADAEHWLLGGGANASRTMLSTIAGSLITVTGVVFSVTIVAIQLASSQFTPRILRNFIADRSNQLVLGVFISTFTYTLIVLRVIRSRAEQDVEFVPHVAVAMGIVLMLNSIGFLIYFIHHAARSMQASTILRRVSAEALVLVERLFPDEIGEPEDPAAWRSQVGEQSCQRIAADREGYLQAVDGNTLFALGQRGELLIRMAEPVGAFLILGQPVAEVWSAGGCDEQACTEVRAAFIIGAERTPDQDVDFCIIEIADMAVKALSPGINDPTTALHAIDRLTQILRAFGQRQPPAPTRTDAGRIHFIAMHSTFETTLALAFDQILLFGRENPVIVNALRSSVAKLSDVLPDSRREALEAFKQKLG